MKKLIIILLITFPFVVSAQMTYVPDDNFEQALIDFGYDKSPLNDSVPTKNIDTVTSLYISSYNISNLKGIEAFRSLGILDCSSNRLRILDISKNKALIKFWCHFNQLTSLDVTNNRVLREFGCTYNTLTNLDLSMNPILEFMNASNNPNLTCIQVMNTSLVSNNPNWKKDFNTIYALDCNVPDNKMTYVPDDNFEQALINLGYDSGPLNDSVRTKNIKAVSYLGLREKNISDLTGIDDFIALKAFDCRANNLKSLNLNNNHLLEQLDCSGNYILSLDLSKNKALWLLYCNDNYLSTLNLSESSILMILYCEDNELTSLDISKSVSLRYLNCSWNQLTSLDVSNNTVLRDFRAVYNPNLLCIQVNDSSQAVNNKNWRKDERAIYSEDCGNPGGIYHTYIPDDNFEQALIDLGYDSGPLDNFVATKNIDTIKSLDVSWKGISQLIGIEDFITLDSLDCSNNKLTSLDVRMNTALTSLKCSGNMISVLDVSKNPSLTSLKCSDNRLSKLDLSNNLVLEYLYCQSNQIRSLDLSKNPKLKILHSSYNQMTSLDLCKNTFLEWLDCSWNMLTSLNLSKNDTLKRVYCYYNFLTNLDISKNIALISLLCTANDLTSLYVGNNKNLDSLFCAANKLTSLDLSKNTSLGYFYAYNNQYLMCIQVQDSSLAMKNKNWYKDDWAIYSEDCTGVGVDEEINVSNNISISPNPASDYIEINPGNIILSEAKDLKIYNSLGECVLTPLAFGEGPGVRLDISPLPPGVYFVRIGYENRKFIKY